MKTYHSGRKTLVQKLHDNNVPPNQIVQITDHKNLQSINNYSSLKERQMENISKILSSNGWRTASSTTESTKSFPRLQPLKTHSKQCFKAIISVDSGGVFNINLASTKNTITSPELGPRAKKKRYIVESDGGGGSQE